MNIRDEATEMAEEISSELFDIISKKLEVLSELDKKLKKLENVLDNHINNSKIIAIENERMITEKYEELSKNDEDNSMNLMSEIEDLKSEINSLKKERSY